MEKPIAKLADFNIEELEEWLANSGLGSAGMRKFRGGQIFKWFGAGAQAFAEMTDLPLGLRSELGSRAETGMPEVVNVRRSARDGTAKYAMLTGDGQVIESVYMRHRHGNAACVSSQAGCRMGCAFCASKPDKFARSLSPGEMLGQAAAINRYESAGTDAGAAEEDFTSRAGEADFTGGAKNAGIVSHVVVMGVGEPFNNYENTLKFVRLLHAHKQLNIGYRRITISTCGIVPGILRLAEEGLPVGLSVSLHSADDAVRSVLMPVNRSFSIDKLLEGCKIYTYKTKRRVTFEYALIDGVNDAPGDARGLLRKIRGMLCHVNLIPLNITEAQGYAPSPKDRVRRFYEILIDGGAKATVRRELGADISAACGQLRNSYIAGRD